MTCTVSEAVLISLTVKKVKNLTFWYTGTEEYLCKIKVWEVLSYFGTSWVRNAVRGGNRAEMPKRRRAKTSRQLRWQQMSGKASDEKTSQLRP